MLSLKKLNLKPLHPFFFAPKHAFTLVELIVVISVLGVLATIAFTQISNVTLSARNSTRMTNIQSISSSLDIYKATNWTYPIPDEKTDILYSGSTIGYQGYIKDTTARLLKLSPNSSQDPLNTSTYFSYATNASRTNFQLLWFLEANTTSFKTLPATFASDELTTKTPYSKGEELGILYTSGTTTPLAWTSIELNTLTNPYTAYYNSTDSITWTGNILQNLVISYAHGSGFGSPSTDDCPTGFIPVPGNKDFNQLGFCVMKYEAKALWGAVWSYNGHSYNAADTIVSNATDYPINYVTQPQAITACQSIGAHLITNNEWMTIARNIEATPSNWSSGIVWNGYIYSWHNDNVPANLLVASADDNNGYLGTWDSATSPWDSAFTNFTSNVEQAYKWQKRTLTLSNGNVIWDLAGNNWEHVNKANTIDGTNYNSSTIWQSNACGGDGWYAFTNNATTDTVAQCNFSPTYGYTYANTGPLTPNLNAANGIGRIYSYNTASNIFLRGGHWAEGAYAGVFTLGLTWAAGASAHRVGFRCAR